MYKPEFCCVIISSAWTEEDISPFRVVGAVGEKLGFQANGLPGVIGRAALPTAGVKAVCGVDLHAGLVGPDLQDNAGTVSGEPGGPPQALRGVEDEVVVVSAGVAQLLVAGVDIPGDGFFGGEVKGGPGHGTAHGDGDTVGPHGGVPAGG